jgi:hypothetical protein
MFEDRLGLSSDMVNEHLNSTLREYARRKSFSSEQSDSTKSTCGGRCSSNTLHKTDLGQNGHNKQRRAVQKDVRTMKLYGASLPERT